jgi:hypothetical protein
MSEENKFYSESYWYNNPVEHEDVSNYNENYYVYKIYKNILFNLKDIPKDGFIVVLGTNKCVSFDLLCNHFGSERCIGYDIANPKKHPRVIVKDCNLLGDDDNIPIAFCHNDLGSFPTTPALKIHGQKWATKNIIKGGYFLGRNNLNAAQFKAEELMEQNGFKNYLFKNLERDFDLSTLDDRCIEGHMLSQKL